MTKEKLIKEINKNSNYPNYCNYLIKIYEYTLQRQRLENDNKNIPTGEETSIDDGENKSNPIKNTGDSE